MVHVGSIQSKMQLGVDLQAAIKPERAEEQPIVGHGRPAGVMAWSSRRPAGQRRAAGRRLELLQGGQDPIGRRSLLNQRVTAA